MPRVPASPKKKRNISAAFVGSLLLGGAVTGIVVGIAAQQALGNLFAGVVLDSLLTGPHG